MVEDNSSIAHKSEKQIVQISIDVGESIQKIQKQYKGGNFKMVGDNKKFDAIGELLSMTQNEGKVFKLILDNICYKDNQADIRIHRNMENPTQRSKFSSAFSKLKKKGILKRVKKGIYMINPDFVMPSSKYYDMCVDKWKELK